MPAERPSLMERFIGFWVDNKLLVALLVESVAAMVFAQLLHAASFGLYRAVAIQLVHRAFTAGHQGRGQALYSSISFGAGGAAASLAPKPCAEADPPCPRGPRYSGGPRHPCTSSAVPRQGSKAKRLAACPRAAGRRATSTLQSVLRAPALRTQAGAR